MTFDRNDFARIQWSLLTALALIAAGSALIVVSDRHHRTALREQTAVRAQLDEFESKLRQVRAEENEIKQKASLFSRLQARGIIGEEQRLDWVELIKEIRDLRKLLDVQYEFSPQQTLDKGSAGGYTFKSSAMRLQMKLLHEMDLLNFINDLRQHAKAYVRVRACTVSRVPRTIGTGGDGSQLTAECELEWITILPAGGAT